MVIYQKYKDILDNLINSSDTQSYNKLRQNNKGLYNIPRSESSLMVDFKGDLLNKNVLNTLLKLALRI